MQLLRHERPPRTCCSPKGGIASELLKGALERTDLLDLFPRTQGGPVPLLLSDGHGSRFQLPFMRCIDDEERKWKVCTGVPNGAAHWQAGDSPEQNGSWKMATTRDKRDLSRFKMSMSMPLNTKPTDIIPLCNSAWPQLFARVESSKRAISASGSSEAS